MSLMPRGVFFCLISLSLAVPLVEAKPKVQSQSRVSFAGKKATSLQGKRVTPQRWSGSENQSSLLNKRFPMQNWDHHFSSLGSKRSGIEVTGKEKEIFETKLKTYPKKEMELSRWNDKMKDLHKDAQLVEDAQPLKKAADEQMYTMMLQDRSTYEDLGAELSLRDLNKFQFRRNRSAGEVPIQAVAEGE